MQHFSQIAPRVCTLEFFIVLEVLQISGLLQSEIHSYISVYGMYAYSNHFALSKIKAIIIMVKNE